MNPQKEIRSGFFLVQDALVRATCYSQRRALQFVTVPCFVLSLASCGVIYKSPTITQSSTDDANVQIVNITGSNLAQANKSEFRPRTLPIVFSNTAGTGTRPRSDQTLPEGAIGEQVRPARPETRLPPSANPGPYEIGVGDVVLLATPGTGTSVAELSGLLAAQNSRQGYTVQDDGAIAIPDVGRVKIANMTIDAAEAELFQRLVEKQIDPAFSLEIAEFKAHRVSIGGAVGKPTLAPITLTPLYLDELIAAAGGISASDQDVASVRIYRSGKLYQIPLNQLYAKPALLHTQLVKGDSVFVDTEYDLSQAQAYFEQQILLDSTRRQRREIALEELTTEVSLRRANLSEARTNFLTRTEFDAVKRDYVYLTGEVKKQSRYALPFEQRPSLADALFDSGGGVSIATGDISQIYVLRASASQKGSG
ncbi:MAG: polysaccharide biosynthesis/export family protein, partial [Roseibium sp.]